MITAIIIAVVVILVLWVIAVQNKLVKLDEFCNNALKQINVQQMTRFDALKTMVNMAREYATDVESKTIIEAIEARNLNHSARPTPSEINENEKILGQAMMNLNAVVEQYPQLRSMDLYANAQNDYRKNEDQVRLSRMTFNDTVTKFNMQVRQFPGSIVASILSFPVKDYLEEDKSKADIPDIFPAKK
ncbi:MAG: LemA family protein [Bacteroidales bacterium]|nr:LemA family protein [Bacteroidales bacterium]MBR6246845.1 LemA family protein [Bacteroidales bacterium]